MSESERDARVYVHAALSVGEGVRVHAPMAAADDDGDDLNGVFVRALRSPLSLSARGACGPELKN